MEDQVIDTAAAQGLQAYAGRSGSVVGGVIMRDQAAYPGAYVARLVGRAPTPYVLLADTLARLRDKLPPGSVRSDRQPADPPEVVEVWFAE